MLPLLKILRSQGFGSKRECLGLLRSEKVEWGRPASCGKIEWTTETDPDALLEREGLWLRVDGFEQPVVDHLYIALNKPAGVECSHAPDVHESVFSFVPPPFLRRGLQPVGRLDADTTGLLLLTDDGTFNHAITSPRRKLPKTYRVRLRHPLTDEQAARLEAGVVLRDDPAPTLPATVRRLGEREADIVISEGRYHQIKRMAAAVGNRVEAIHRIAIGALELGDLPEGEWRYLEPGEVGALFGREA